MRYAVLVAQNKVICSLVRVIDLLIRAALLDHEHRYAQFVYLEQLLRVKGSLNCFTTKFPFSAANWRITYTYIAVARFVTLDKTVIATQRTNVWRGNYGFLRTFDTGLPQYTYP